MTPPPAGGPGRPHPAPAPLTVAASLTAVEALVFAVLAVWEAASVEAQKAVMGTTTALFFVLYGAGLAACAWARAPVVLAQLIQLYLAWSFLGGSTTWVAAGLAVVAAVVLAGIFHPQSLDALAEHPERG